MAQDNYKFATFAGGCFWCIEHPFDELDGVHETLSGYIGGHKDDPTYKEVSTGKTGHYEAVQVRYDPERVDYATLLKVFWRQIDPTDAGGQFVDRGSQYKTAVFYHDDEQKQLAADSKEKLNQSGRFDKPIVTEIKPATVFYPAEDYHQDYYRTCPAPYQRYRVGTGRDEFIEGKWGEE